MSFQWLSVCLVIEDVFHQLTCMNEALSDGKVRITCETNRTLESLTCSVDNEPPQPCE